MPSPALQSTLSQEQIAAFHHDGFVDQQVADFMLLLGDQTNSVCVVADVGGGCGLFAKRLKEVLGCRALVIEMDPASIKECTNIGVEAKLDDALNPRIVGDEDIVSFNLILHHLVGGSSAVTSRLQTHALSVWRTQARAVFVNEY